MVLRMKLSTCYCRPTAKSPIAQHLKVSRLPTNPVGSLQGVLIALLRPYTSSECYWSTIHHISPAHADLIGTAVSATLGATAPNREVSSSHGWMVAPKCRFSLQTNNSDITVGRANFASGVRDRIKSRVLVPASSDPRMLEGLQGPRIRILFHSEMVRHVTGSVLTSTHLMLRNI